MRHPYKLKLLAFSKVFLLIVVFHLKSFSQVPNITSVAPNPVCQGDTVMISGTGFIGATSVTVGSLNAASFKVKDDKTIVAYTNINAMSGTVQVMTPAGSSNILSITINPSPQPSLSDISPSVYLPFTNCDGNKTYTLSVKNTSIPAGGSCDYDIDWGDGSTHFKQKDWPVNSQTSHLYSSQGYFYLKITITPANGCKKQKIINFYNGANPLATFSTLYPTTSMCADTTVIFTIGDWFKNTPGTYYRIIFGDGTDTTLQNPLNLADSVQWVKHTYKKSSCPSQDFTAILDGVNGCYTKEYTQNQIVVRIKPKANFDFSQTACVNEKVCFNDKTVAGSSGAYCDATTNYTWDFGDGSSPSGNNSPCHTYTTAGSYKVTLTTGNTACGSDAISKQVIVRPVSSIPTVTSPVTYCQNEPAVRLTATGTNVLWYTKATGGTGASTAPTPATSSPGTKTYYVSQTLNGQCESPRVPITVTVYALPSKPVITSPVQLCKGATANSLTATGANLLWYATATGGPGSATAPAPNTGNTGVAYYYVSQTTNGCEGPRATIEVDVSDIPSAPMATTPVIYCQGQKASPLTASGTGVLWYTTATGGTGSAITPTPATSTPGTIYYYVSSANYCGESERTKIEVNVLAGPSATIRYSKNVLCNSVDDANSPNPPLAVTITGNKAGTFSVRPSGLPIDSTSGTIKPSGATAGTYTIRYSIKNSGGCSDFYDSTTVTITGKPSATINYPAMCGTEVKVDVTLTGTQGGRFTSTTGVSIDATTGTINPSASAPGNYVIAYTIAASLPCPAFTTTKNVTITQAPGASISYGKTNFCNDDNTNTNPPVNVILAGTKGGTFSISPLTGLLIDSLSGTIRPPGAKAGTYIITYTISAGGGCAEYTTNATLIINSISAATINYVNAPFCTGSGSIQKVNLNGTPGGTFSSTQGLSIDANTGDINPSLSQPGKYKITYTIAPSLPCPGFTTSTNIMVNESPAISFNVTSQSVCSAMPVVFKPTSSVATTVYNWNVQGSLPANISGVTSGTTSDPNAVISLLFTNTGSTSEAITIVVTPVNPTGNSCSGNPYELTLTVYPVPSMLKADTTEFCMHSPSMALTTNADPGNTVKWYDAFNVPLNQAPVINTSNTARFNFYATQTNVFGCKSPVAKLVAIVNPVAKIVSSSYTNPTLCGVPSGSVSLQVVDLNDKSMPDIPVLVHYTKFQTAYSIAESTDALGKIIIPLTAGTYSDFYVETFGCLSQKIPGVFILKDPDPPAQPVAGYNPPLCSESTLSLSAVSASGSQGGPLDYVWVGPAFGPFADTVRNTFISFPSASVSDAGTYIVYAIQNNCISSPASFQVVIRQAPSKPIINTRTPLCVGDDLALQAISSIPGNNPMLTYSWTGPGTGFPVNSPNVAINHVKLQDAGVYTITVTSPQTGCSSAGDTLIQVGGYPVVQFAHDSLTLPTGYLLNLNPVITNINEPGILPMKSFEWSPAQDLVCNDALCSSPTVTIKGDACYTVKATNIYGCSGTDVICIKVFCKSSQIFIPNAFTPHGDLQENVKFMVRASGVSTVKSFRVFNRWGRIVFERDNFPPNNPDFGWDGRFNGKFADVGVYVYTVEAVCDNGVSYIFKGNVTLL
ncbi:MAG: PKD domain-containing protein [Ginsengibacter sp.]